MRGFAQDLRYGARLLARSPGFAALAVLTLALGVGATTAVFSIVAPMLFEPLPYPQPDRIAEVTHFYRGQPGAGLTAAEAFDMRDQQRVFSAFAILDAPEDANLVAAHAVLKVHAMAVSHGYFPVLGVVPALGRGFTAAEDVPGASPTAVLSDALWRSEFAADPAIVGRQFELDGKLYTVVGVMPRGFVSVEPGLNGFESIDVWTALQPSLATLAPLGPNLDVLVRLRPGVTLSEANAELHLLRAAWRRTHPQAGDGGWAQSDWAARSYHDSIAGDSSQSLLLLFGAVGLVLLIACANVANLLLARANGRRREMAVRAALGANPGRLARQLLAESLLLGLLGAFAGVLLAAWGAPLVTALMPADEALPLGGHLDAWALLFTLALALATSVLFGLAPTLAAARLRLVENLKEGGAGGESRGRGRLRRGLVVVEVGLAFVLLAGAGLLAASLVQLHRVNPGFATAGVLTAQTTITGPRLQSTAATDRYVEAVLANLQRSPGVAAAAAITGIPLMRAMNYPVVVPGQEKDQRADEWRAVTPGFFAALSIPLVQGRPFSAADTAASARVAIVSRRFADHYWPHQSPLGRALVIPDPSGPGRTAAQVVGVAADIHENGLDVPPPFTVYVPLAQASDAINALVNHWFPMGFVVRGSGAALGAEVRAAFQQADPNQPVYNLASLAAVKQASLGQYSFLGALLGGFAALALALAGIGIFGVLQAAVAQRRREIGIRMALGEGRGRVLRRVVLEGLRLAAIGLALGLAAALALRQVLAGLIYGVSPANPAVLGLGALALLALAALAALQPAWRATAVDPLEALRSE